MQAKPRVNSILKANLTVGYLEKLSRKGSIVYFLKILLIHIQPGGAA
jgi:hypothetical protein